MLRHNQQDLMNDSQHCFYSCLPARWGLRHKMQIRVWILESGQEQDRSPHIHTVWYRASSSWASDTWGSSSSTVINICMTLNKSFVFSESQCLCCKGEITIFIILLLILHYNDIWYVVCYFIILTILLCLISLLWGANETMFVKLLCKGWKIIKMKMEYLEK